jgi:hypothetical protein
MCKTMMGCHILIDDLTIYEVRFIDD